MTESTSPRVAGPIVLEPEYNPAVHEFLDSGAGRKLERFGDWLLDRPEPKAWWKPALTDAVWKNIHARFDEKTGRFETNPDLATQQRLRAEGLVCELKLLGGSKHVGFFPEQQPHRTLIAQKTAAAVAKSGKKPALLSLFGYTGATALVAAKAGADVVHVDASKPAINWAVKNRDLSQINPASVRFILDDAVKFVKREIRRGRRYDAIVLDPPSFGRGPKGEIWKVEEQLPELLADLRTLASENPYLHILTLYNLDASPLMLGNVLQEALKGLAGTIQTGELALRETGPAQRPLPLSLYARWTPDEA